MKRRKIIRRIAWAVTILFVLLNAMAYMHAYKFTHFSNADAVADVEDVPKSFSKKLLMAVTGVSASRPRNTAQPLCAYITERIGSNNDVEAWYMDQPESKGTVIIFHGYKGDKSKMLDKADVFFEIGYNTLVVDFMGSGGSEGNATTIGFKEAQQVLDCYKHIIERDSENRIYLFGTSLGAVAILKAINDHGITPAGIIIECPFGTMYQTVSARFKMVGMPAFPMAGLLVFWGGVQHGFWGFSHNPVEYAGNVTCPTLLLYGEKDDRVSREEIDAIFNNLQGEKYRRTYPDAGHSNYLKQYPAKWKRDVSAFLNATAPQ